MSANYPPPQQPGGQNPFAQQQYAPQPGQSPYGPPAPGGFNGGYPPPPPAAPAQDNVALGLLVGLAAALVAALIYGLIIKGTKHEIGYAALAVGALVGFAVGKVGGRNPILPVLGIPLALFGVYAGKMFGIALLLASAAHIGVVEVFTDHFSVLQDAWKDSMDGKDILFFCIAGFEGFVVAKRVAD